MEIILLLLTCMIFCVNGGAIISGPLMSGTATRPWSAVMDVNFDATETAGTTVYNFFSITDDSSSNSFDLGVYYHSGYGYRTIIVNSYTGASGFGATLGLTLSITPGQTYSLEFKQEANGDMEVFVDSVSKWTRAFQSGTTAVIEGAYTATIPDSLPASSLSNLVIDGVALPPPTTSNPTTAPTTSPTTSNPTTSPTTSNPTTSPTISNPTTSPTASPTTCQCINGGVCWFGTYCQCSYPYYGVTCELVVDCQAC